MCKSSQARAEEKHSRQCQQMHTAPTQASEGKINSRDWDRHSAFCVKLILSSLLTGADFLSELVNGIRVICMRFLDC